jgi:MFS family permease
MEVPRCVPWLRRGSRSPGGVVGALVVVEATSGVIQGYYTPLLNDIARHLGIPDAGVNWLEVGQLLLSALVVPVLARLGDMFGHRRILVWSLGATAVASWAVAFAPTFPTFVTAWALEGFYVAWLPLNVAIIYSRARKLPDGPALTRKGAGVIVMALQAGVILGALLGGQLGEVFTGRLWLTLSVPALLVTGALLVVMFKVADPGVRHGGKVDTSGAVVLSLALVAITGGLSLVRLHGVTAWVFAAVVVGLALIAWFVRMEGRSSDPLIDLSLLRRPTVWPVMLTSGLFGVSVLGAQGPLSTFVRTNPAKVGYGLGLTSASASYIIGAYVVSLLAGAALFARVSASTTPRVVLIGATLFVAAGYHSLIALHRSVPEVLACMMVAGLGSGALVAALPAAAAAAAPPHQTGVATGLTNTTKSIGGSFASSTFALALMAGAADGVDSTAASMSGYLTAWAICGGTALLATVALRAVPKVAFTGASAEMIAGAELT